MKKRRKKRGGETLAFSGESLFNGIIEEVTEIVKKSVLSVIERGDMGDEEFGEYSRLIKEALSELPRLLPDIKKDIILTLSNKQYNNEIKKMMIELNQRRLEHWRTRIFEIIEIYGEVPDILINLYDKASEELESLIKK